MLTSMEGTVQPQCLFDRASRQANSSSKPLTKRPAYIRKHLQIVQVNAINPFPIPLVYNAALLNIHCCMRGALFLFCHVVSAICVIFYHFKLNNTDTIRQFWSSQLQLILLTPDTIGLCLLLKCDCHFSQDAAYVVP